MTLGSFIHQKSYEKIEYEIRKHPITFVPAVVMFLFLMVAPIGVYFLINQVAPAFLSGGFSQPLLILLVSFYYLSIGLFLYSYFVTFYIDVLIITNDRLLHIQQQNLFARTISELDLCNIQDVTSEVHGFFPSLFRYGVLEIQTASAIEKFIIEKIPHPEMLRQVILDLAEEDKKYTSLHKR